MRKLLSLLLTSVMLFTSGSFSVLAKEPSAAENSSPYSTQETITVSPRIVHSYKKTVKKVYKNLSSIPESISYSEYNADYEAWFSGTLYLQSSKKVSNGYQATFSGTLVGRI